ncbi:MAG: hypothetical protein QW303_07820 [Nitrososphaerota archaeon]
MSLSYYIQKYSSIFECIIIDNIKKTISIDLNNLLVIELDRPCNIQTLQIITKEKTYVIFQCSEDIDKLDNVIFYNKGTLVLPTKEFGVIIDGEINHISKFDINSIFSNKKRKREDENENENENHKKICGDIRELENNEENLQIIKQKKIKHNLITPKYLPFIDNVLKMYIPRPLYIAVKNIHTKEKCDIRDVLDIEQINERIINNGLKKVIYDILNRPEIFEYCIYRKIVIGYLIQLYKEKIDRKFSNNIKSIIGIIRDLNISNVNKLYQSFRLWKIFKDFPILYHTNIPGLSHDDTLDELEDAAKRINIWDLIKK